MSDPLTYRFFGQVQQIDDKGQTVDAGWSCMANWVQYADYARLKAENSRLRKAGDRLVFALEAMDIVMDMDSDHPEVAEWNAAKEGQP